MSHKKLICGVLIAVLFVTFVGSASAVNSREIEAVNRKALVDKEVLSPNDIKVIEKFLDDAFVEMVETEDYTEMIDVRDMIVVLAGSTKEPSEYLMTYRTATAKQVGITLKAMEQWEDGIHRTLVKQNLLILAAQIDGPDMIGYGLQFLGDESTVIRYWAAKMIAGDAVANLLNSDTSADVNLEANVIKALSQRVDVESEAGIVAVIAKFAGKVNSSAAEELLLKVADRRIAEYADWSVEYEAAESDILMALGAKAIGEGTASKKAVMAGKFAQLYSYVIQRYIIGQSILSDESKVGLVSVIAGIENSLIGKMMDRPQSVMRRAIEKKRLQDLQAEHDDLLGSDLRAGELAKKLNFNYGKDSAGKAIDMPTKLELPK